MNTALWRLSRRVKHIQRPDCQISFHMVANRPANDATRMEINDLCQIKPVFTVTEIGPTLSLCLQHYGVINVVVSVRFLFVVSTLALKRCRRF
jgi:hypothetical protein